MKNILKSIHAFSRNYATFPDRLFIMFITTGTVLGSLLSLLNDLEFHYTTVLLFVTHITNISWVNATLTVFFGTFFLLYGLYIREESPRSSTFILGLGFFSWTLFTNLIFVNGLQATPFPPIDHLLVTIDQWMHINTPAIMAWTHHHPPIHHALNFIYMSLICELVGIPILLSIFETNQSLCVFYISILIAMFLGGVIYYFFPTMAPSGVFHSPYFSIMQQDTSLRFYEVHHFLKVSTSEGGLIAFPSFHVIWAILLTYPWRNRKIIFYPLACYNVILIASTVLLGWHYFTDVIGGIIVAAVSVLFATILVVKTHPAEKV